MRRALLVTALAAALVAAPAVADQQIAAGPGQRYLTTSVTIAQGERLTFANHDVTGHDVTARADASDGRPLFETPVVAGGGQAPVEGSQYLTTGSYEFFCSLHTDMHGTLTVTAAGTPAKRPPGDSRAPGVALALAKGARLSAIARSGRVRLRVTADEAASVELDGTLRVASRTYSLTGARRDVAAARKTVLSLKLPDGARLAAAKAKSARVRISAGARDAAGNRGSSSLRRKLRR